MTKAPYDNLDFRKGGIAAALDKQAIADKAEQGYVDQASQSGLMLPAQEKLLDPDLPNQASSSRTPTRRSRTSPPRATRSPAARWSTRTASS